MGVGATGVAKVGAVGIAVSAAILGSSEYLWLRKLKCRTIREVYQEVTKKKEKKEEEDLTRVRDTYL